MCSKLERHMADQTRRVSRRLRTSRLAPSNADRAAWGASAITGFANVTGMDGDLRTDPETVLADLLTDLMHWCNESPPSSAVTFESALSRARGHYVQESEAAPRQ
jgi:hypothetical protein